ncbi:MAG: hypothetical protein WD225_10390 [Ilumatobacteraceae bacterium]
MDEPLRRVAAIAKRQLGAFSRQQAHEVGVTDRQLHTLCQRACLEQLGPNAFRANGAPVGPRAELLGLLLDVGGDAVVSGPTAAALHGFDGFGLRPPFHVTIGRGRDVQRIGHIIHTTTALPLIDRARVDGIPTTAPARTLIDLARSESPERLTAAFDSGLRDGRFNETLVHRRIVDLRTRGRFGIPKLLAVIDGSEITRGGHSWLEREFLRLVATAELPRPETQVVLSRARDRTVRVDFRFTGTPVVVEVLGYRFHRSKAEMQRDADRLRALVLEGLAPLQFTYDDVVSSSSHVVSDLRRAFCVSDQTDARPDR